MERMSYLKDPIFPIWASAFKLSKTMKREFHSTACGFLTKGVLMKDGDKARLPGEVLAVRAGPWVLPWCRQE